MLVSVIRIKDVAGADRSILYRSRFDIFVVSPFAAVVAFWLMSRLLLFQHKSFFAAEFDWSEGFSRLD